MVKIAIVDKSKCSPRECGDYLCMKLCPVNRTSQDCISKFDEKIIINEEMCIGCKICSKRCPFEAIRIINLPEALNEDAFHRYGKNSFRLFSMPVPKKGIVVGIVGRNGIGKSTALDILSGKLIPNLGDYNNEGNKEKVVSKFSNSLLGEYLSKLYEGKIKVSYKPQRIDLLPKVYQGNVKELIDKVDERGIKHELIEKLELKGLLGRDIKELSGGELQKLALLATICKDADFYFFDEPVSFCDITSRIKIAKLIRGLAEEGKSVIVVEHDLATLDYISDEIQVIYGERGGYGITSQSKAVKRGINEYLDGYLPDDNIRFRNYSIVFREGIEKNVNDLGVLFDFPELVKEYKGFKLEVNKGEVHRGEVLCVVGSNGLGKSTFLKLLAGIEEPDKGKVDKVKIAYKEQYPKDLDGTVRERLMEVAGSKFDSGWFKVNLLEKLGLGNVLDNEVSKLSGGELQKFFIALTLSKDCEVYALDEPSAFIDVEDRLNVAAVIKEFVEKNEVSAIVVDHDIQFIDYLSDSLLVFEGKPGILGYVYGPCDKKEGMNRVLKNLEITYRKDKDTKRARINKPGSQLDNEQKKKEKYYYS